MAKFVIHLRFRPADYWAMTGEERMALIDEWAETQRKRK